MLQWNTMYETGVQEVDNQHKKLFEMVNAFDQSIRDKTAEKKIDETLNFLGGYVQTHFQHEEKCMAEMKCPVSEKNAASHNAFLKTYTEFVQRFKTEGYSDALAKELHKTAEAWLVKHICGIDVHLKFCVKKSATA
ncbi:MAG: hemerythrin [Calditrichaeota bacterium]|nr:MAG: hemerythrin [Calditrichota bacterium]